MAESFEKQPLVVIGGPTASGKSSLAIAMAKKFNGEILSADSMQIYRGLNIGTAKTLPDEMQGIPHHLQDILPPDKNFSVADYVCLARETVEDIRSRGKLPIVCGGTGLYIQGLLNGISYAENTSPDLGRKNLEQELAQNGAAFMHEKLAGLDAAAAEEIHPNNTVRVIRAIEILQANPGITLAEYKQKSLSTTKPYRSLFMCIGFADRNTLYRRIDFRIDHMMDDGLLQEARAVYQHRTQWKPAAKAIGYKEFFDYFEGKDGLENCVQKLKYGTHQYAKRQLTWFRHSEDVQWLDGGAEDMAYCAAKRIQSFLTAER